MKRKYSHVVVYGVDGVGGFIEKADTPNFDRIFADGSVTHKALASFPSISAEGWGSILIGASPAVHELTNQNIGSHPIGGGLPSLFGRIRKEHPDVNLCALCCWGVLVGGIIETDIGVHTRIRSEYSETAACEEIEEMIIDDAARILKEEKPELLFIEFDSMDKAGHLYGYGSKKYYARLHEVDTLLGRLWKAIEDAGIADDTLLLLTGDHGGQYHGEDIPSDHGGWTEDERYVTFAARGKTVKKGCPDDANIRDLPAVILYALGIEAPEFDLEGWTSQIPVGLYDDPEIDTYLDISGERGAAPAISKVQYTSEEIE